MTPPSAHAFAGFAIGCVVALLLYMVAMISATVWAIVDLTGSQEHKVLAIVVLVWVGLSVLGGAGRARS